MTSSQIRQAFLEFFRSKQHQIVPSAPIVVKNDPTLMFTNAGMNQFKDYFLGNKQAPSPRIADTQKCLRVSGKHNDLEEVGVDHYHHTMFEMLGNWSFGDYFKSEAIAWSWELLNGVLKIPKEQLYVTVFGGDANEGLPMDEEAAAEWRKWVPEDRILLGSKKDNFWEMGDTGPCGPCTEIHVDTRPESERKAVDGKTLVNADHPKVIEIWNNVFIQFNRLKDASLQPLPQKHVDTGMGFERLTRVLQNKSSNYDTDIFSGTIEKIESITGKKYDRSDSKEAVAFRVLADHIRAISFTIADGQLPAATGAGYVIRRILRRAVRYYYSYLDYKQPLLHQLVPVLAHQFADVFPELKEQEGFVSKVVKEEEEAFLKTLEKGIRRFEEIVFSAQTVKMVDSRSPNTPKKPLTKIFGSDAFMLYDTFGFPLDLTILMAKEKGLEGVEIEEFERLLNKQKDRSRAATAIDAGDWITVNEAEGNSRFVGYDHLQSDAQILRYRKVKGKGKESYQIVLDQTPFYAESGGQVGDVGDLLLPSPTGEGPGVRLAVIDTKKENDLIIHFAEQIPDDISGTVHASVDKEIRLATEAHHSATHLLHAALRKVLGNHVAQKGSLVNALYLRFDFSHFSKMSPEEIAQVEAVVNEKIRENVPVNIEQLPKEEALARGAMALFGEKYGDTVRVVTIDRASSSALGGTFSQVSREAEEKPFSVELCGGTHVKHSGSIGFFKIISEGAVAAGVRRIEAVAGKAAEDYINNQLVQLASVKEQLKNPKDLIKSIQSLSDENARQRKELERWEEKSLQQQQQSLLPFAHQKNGYQLLTEVVEVNSADALKRLAHNLSVALGSAIVSLSAVVGDRLQVAIAITPNLVSEKGLDANKLIKEVAAPVIKGGGGGQKSLATGSGSATDAAHAVLKAVQEVLPAV